MAPLAPIIGSQRIRIDKGLRQPRQNATGYEEEKEARVAHGILDVVAKDPEKQHVAAQMIDTAVEEHGGQQGRPRRDHIKIRRQTHLIV
tara:strand:+ start:2094 stop:2360 length:267 start_codon:yes stop_codon:yes gene_type:complete